MPHPYVISTNPTTRKILIGFGTWWHRIWGTLCMHTHICIYSISCSFLCIYYLFNLYFYYFVYIKTCLAYLQNTVYRNVLYLIKVQLTTDNSHPVLYRDSSEQRSQGNLDHPKSSKFLDFHQTCVGQPTPPLTLIPRHTVRV